MRDSFELESPKEAEKLLASLPSAIRRKGEAYFREGRVGELVCITPGALFSTLVRGSESEPYEVELAYEDGDGWIGSCSCPMEIECKHVYAAMKALLAENSAAHVRRLSAGLAQPRQKSATPKDKSLAEQLSEALNRSLKGDEIQFLGRLSKIYHRCRQSQTISIGDFDELGFRMGGYLWDRADIWPAFPATEHEFWLYLANAVQAKGQVIPKFMEPITDLGAIRDRLARWKREREIAQWRRALEMDQKRRRRAQSSPEAKIDLRIKLSQTCASLEFRRENETAFQPVKMTFFRRLEDEYVRDAAHFTLEGELIWAAFAKRALYSSGPALQYHDGESKRILWRLLRLELLRSRFVNHQGEPYIYAAECLRWSMTSEPDAAGDYQLQLVHPDGTALNDCFLTLPGSPTFYVTATTIFNGPSYDGPLIPEAVNAVPAPAIETSAGLQFLIASGIEVPQRLRGRIRTVPLRVKIFCELRVPYAGSSSEICAIRVIAQSEDGQVEEIWTGSQWDASASVGQRRGARNELTLYDRSTLDRLPALIEPLDLKWEAYQQALSLRITRKFPEVFVPWIKSLPPEYELHLEGELASLARDPLAGKIQLDVTEVDLDWFDLKVVLNVTDTELTPEELKLLLNAKGQYVRLEKKGWRRLEFALTEEEDERLAQIGLTPHELSAEPQRLHALQLANDAAKRFLPEQQVAQIQRRAGEIKARVTPEIPASIRAGLRPYQTDGFHFLAYLSTNRFGGILADDMGLGKTLQALTWLVWLREDPPTAKSPSLVVCPKSVMDNWRAEAERFAPGLRVKVWRPAEIDRFLGELASADLHVINYTQLRNLGESLAPVLWLAVILDEGQYIKNPSSQTAQVARSLHAKHRLALSGTPIENRLLDLWSLMAFAMPGILGSRSQFGRLFDQKEDPFARRRLSARVRPFLLRRTKAQVAKELPDRVEEDLFCEIEGEQKTLYSAELKQAQQLLLRVKTQKELNRERFNFLTSLLRLRQICCHPALVKPDSKAESAKVNALIEQLDPLMDEGHKVLVFSQFVSLLDLLRPALGERGWPLFYLAGDTENRGRIVENFQSAEGAAVFLISLKAGGFGLNLTAASYVLLFDPWWNPAVENQAIDRTHRIGQTNKVMAYRLLIKDSIEEKIRLLQKQKSRLAEDVLGEERFAQQLTIDDLQFLFAD